MSTAKPLPIALTISGAVALGAYEGGVLAALIAGLRPLYVGDQPQVRIDVIGGASAGSITGLLAARCIVEGTDPVKVMQAAWVAGDDLTELMDGAKGAPLSTKVLEQVAADVLRMPGVTAAQQRSAVHVTMALGALRGLEYEIAGDHFSTNAIRANTYLDWKNMVVSPGQPLTEFVHDASYRPGVDEPKMVDFALASGANPFGFPPRAVNRQVDEAEYSDHRIDNFPPSKAYWYTDGGTIDNEPVGRTLDLAGELDANDDLLRRLLVLIHPDPTAAPRNKAWADPGNVPTWVETLARAQKVQTTQSIYDDIRHAVKTNRRVEEVAKLATVLAAAIDQLPPAARSAATAQLATFTKKAEAPGTTTEDHVRDALRNAAGLAGKHTIGIEVLSPLLLPEAQGPDATPVKNLLAGEFLMHFGGFARAALRQHDFDLGYRTVTSWFERDRPLKFHGLDDTADDTAVQAARNHYTASSDNALGTTTYKKLTREERWKFKRMFGRMAFSVYGGLRHPSHQ